MQEIKEIKYINKIYHDDQETIVEHTGSAIYQFENNIHMVSFDLKGNHIQIRYGHTSIILTNHQTRLVFKQNQRIENDYQTPYGKIKIQTELEDLLFDDYFVRIKYRLFQQNQIIVKAELNIEYVNDEKSLF